MIEKLYKLGTILISSLNKIGSLVIVDRKFPRTPESKEISVEMDPRLVCILLLPIAMSLHLEDLEERGSCSD